MGTEEQIKANPIRLNSLRARYLTVSIILAATVITSAFLADRFVDNVGSQSTTNMEGRNQLLHISRLIRNSVWEAEFALQAHALTPTPDLVLEVRLKIDKAIYQANYLKSIPWIHRDRRNESIDSLIRGFSQFKSEAGALMEIRGNYELLFPAMKIMVDEMLPLNTAFYTAAALAMEEYDPTIDKSTLEIHRYFSEVNYLWSRIISIFRVYAANRTGIFGEPEKSLLTQSANLDIFYSVLLQQLNYLIQLRNEDILNLQASESALLMLNVAKKWYQLFLKVKQINTADNWRVDVKIVRSKISPLLSNIRENLLTLDKQIERSVEKDVVDWAQVAQSITQSFWTLAIVALAFIVIGYLSFSHSVLRPIALVANALKAESLGKSGEIYLPKVRTSETQDLIRAFSEMRKQVHERQAQLEFHALHDTLTGLPNRKLLVNQLELEIKHSQLSGQPLALLIMDLNRFKEINDTLGHHVGDEVLKQVGIRLVNLMNQNTLVARLGGDEFAFLVANMEHEQQAEMVAEQTLKTLEQIVTVDHYKLYVGASVGIAYYPEHGKDVNTLIQRADVAMYEAKKTSTGYAIYDIDRDQYSVGRLALIRYLRTAIDEGALELHYQPKADVATGEVLGVEALLRWVHPEIGMVPTDKIVEIAEHTGLIKPLTQWVLNTAIRQCAQWIRMGLNIRVAVNLSARNFQDPDLIDEISASLKEWQVPPFFLELEITESAMMADPVRATEILRKLDAMGIHLAVDDFGTGFSSLAYLKRLPVDELKIHKSFVVNMAQDENDIVIVRSTIDLAHNLGLKVVAEGVQDEKTWEMLEELGCDTIQGYFLSYPLQADELQTWLKNNYLHRHHAQA